MKHKGRDQDSGVSSSKLNIERSMWGRIPKVPKVPNFLALQKIQQMSIVQAISLVNRQMPRPQQFNKILPQPLRQTRIRDHPDAIDEAQIIMNSMICLLIS